MYLYNQLKENPDYGYCIREHLSSEQRQQQAIRIAKKTIKLINTVADVINNDRIHQRKDQGCIYRGLPRIQCRADFCGSRCQRADFHSEQGGIRNRKHEVYAQRSAHYRNYGWCQCRDVRGGRGMTICLYLWNEL